MQVAHDDSCPACRRPVPGTAGGRVCCAGCLAYHHAGCWRFRPGCAGCGATESLAERDLIRQRGRARRRALLAVVTLSLLALSLVPLRALGWVSLGGVELDVLRVGLVALAVVVVARLAPG